MNNQKLRFAGIAAITGGLLFFVIGLYSTMTGIELEESLWRFVLPFTPLLMAVGAGGLYSLATQNRGARIGAALTAIAALVMFAGFALMGWLDSEVGWSLFASGFLGIPIGLAVFGIFNLRGRVLPRGNGLPLLIGLVGAAGFLWEMGEDVRGIPWEQQSDVGFILAIIAVGLGWTVLGWIMRGISAESSQTPQPA